MMLSFSLLLSLLPLLTQGSSILSVPQALTPVECPSSITTYVIATEVKLEGRNELLTKEERVKFSQIFQGIYNTLTERSCDSYFRRINAVSWIQMSNNLGEVVDLGAMTTSNSTTMATSSSNTTTTIVATRNFHANSSSLPGVNIVYEVTGQCRACPVARGNFELYDDAFRRALQESMRQLQNSNSSTNNYYGGEVDCRCFDGAVPNEPQAPGVQECVDEMNLEFKSLREESGLFENLIMTDLAELNDVGVVILDTMDFSNDDEEEEEALIEVDRSTNLDEKELEQNEQGRTNNAFRDSDDGGNAETSSATMRWKILSPVVLAMSTVVT